jgi:hypothetical protein
LSIEKSDIFDIFVYFLDIFEKRDRLQDIEGQRRPRYTYNNILMEAIQNKKTLKVILALQGRKTTEYHIFGVDA